ncbi:metallophosphoesterase [Pseudorhodoferax sp. Leaf267]|uniref:metallophosphoesterase n=1 Tax=Pseudorhodoferax sp. Leaf267 TaxID=1736316 RepID=UPI0009EC6567|nr:metallophosphoesterase [Pseudorhodoferax sp. Leaf267]
MRLLHLSDIHFREPDCLSARGDRDVPYRTRLEADLAELCHEDQTPVDVILVGGDIAFKGHPDEYKAAKTWLLRIAEICGCKVEGILTVPGNHDVDRAICEEVDVSNAQEAIAKEVGLANRDWQLSRQLRHGPSAEALFKPLSAYNDFAAQFGCSVFPELPSWEKDLKLDGGVTLRVSGLTSVLISGLGGRDNAPGKLFLGTNQIVLNPQEGVLHLVLSHHPPSWFSDAAEAENVINARAKLQFFGHEHDQRCLRPPEFFRFLAGAVNPDRQEPRWNPGYNLVDLQVDGVGLERAVQVHARLRHFQQAPNELFVPLLTQDREEVWKLRLKVPQLPTFGAGPAAKKAPPQAETAVATAAHTAMEAVAREVPPSPPTEADVTEPSTDNLVFRFWQLSGSQMRDIALELGLITKADLKVPPHQRYHSALKLAREKGLLVELAKEIEKREKCA